jgi:hypothetical protein
MILEMNSTCCSMETGMFESTEGCRDRLW